MNLINGKQTSKVDSLTSGRIIGLIPENFVSCPPGKVGIIAKHRLYLEGTWEGSGLVSPHINTIPTPYQHHKIMELHKTMSSEGVAMIATNSPSIPFRMI